MRTSPKSHLTECCSKQTTTHGTATATPHSPRDIPTGQLPRRRHGTCTVLTTGLVSTALVSTAALGSTLRRAIVTVTATATATATTGRHTSRLNISKTDEMNTALTLEDHRCSNDRSTGGGGTGVMLAPFLGRAAAACRVTAVKEAACP